MADNHISITKIGMCVLFFVALLYLWPNLIHEPLHLLGLKMQGISGTINFDWRHWPAHPSITRMGQVQSIGGGLLFLMLPSIISVAILALLWMTRNTPNMFTHFVLLVYLSFDLIINIVGYRNPISDFRFIIAVPGGLMIAGVSAITIMSFAGYMCTRTLRIEKLVPTQ